jgi:hypothetical protein
MAHKRAHMRLWFKFLVFVLTVLSAWFIAQLAGAYIHDLYLVDLAWCTIGCVIAFVILLVVGGDNINHHKNYWLPQSIYNVGQRADLNCGYCIIRQLLIDYPCTLESYWVAVIQFMLNKPLSASTVVEFTRRFDDLFATLHPTANATIRSWHAIATTLAHSELVRFSVNMTAFVSDGADAANSVRSFFTTGVSSPFRRPYPTT